MQRILSPILSSSWQVVVPHELTMGVDTGAYCSLISEWTFKQYWQNQNLQDLAVSLRTYSGESLGVLGKFSVVVCYKDQQQVLPLVVTDGVGPSLLGWDWLAHLKLDWKFIHDFQDGPLNSLISKRKALLHEGLGILQGYETKLYVDPQAVPKYCKAQPVLYAMRANVEAVFEWLVKEGIQELVQFADWAAPIIP